MSPASRRAAALLVLLAASASVSAQPREPVVRVHVLGRAAVQRVTIRAEASAVRLYADRTGTPVATLGPGESAEVEREGDRLRLLAPTTSRTAAVFEAVTAEGQPLAVSAGSHRARYHGALSVESDRERRVVRLVNYAPVEAYVAGVVASEYPFTEIEGVKAQAVLARTYALRARERALAAGAPFDVTDDTGSQVYRGADAETDVSRRAAEDTHGEVLTYFGDLAEATYYSCSGGHTADNDAIWNGNPVPYLRGRPDPYDADCPDYRWTTTADAARVLRALSGRFGAGVTGFEVAARSPEGRATRVRLLGTGRTISGNEFRSAVNASLGTRTVRSTHFTASRSGGQYRFEGRGFGHGVGMSQYGAAGQARQGRSYRDILAFYFAGTDVQPLLDGYDTPPVAASAPPVRYASSTEPAPPRVRPSHPGTAGAAERAAPTRRTAW